MFIKFASFRKIFKPTVAEAGKCLPMLHLCSESSSLAYKNKQANLGNNPFLKTDRPGSQHLKFSSETRDQHFHGFTELLLYLERAFAFAGKRSLYDLLFCLWKIPGKLLTILRCLESMEHWERRRDASLPKAAWAAGR